jgi:hypothetical protein
MGCHPNPNWRTHIFQRGRHTTNQYTCQKVSSAILLSSEGPVNFRLEFWTCDGDSLAWGFWHEKTVGLSEVQTRTVGIGAEFVTIFLFGSQLEGQWFERNPLGVWGADGQFDFQFCGNEQTTGGAESSCPKKWSASEMVDSQLIMLIAFGVRWIWGAPAQDSRSPTILWEKVSRRIHPETFIWNARSF